MHTIHPFLDQFEKGKFTDDGLRRFAIQWYKTARAHKESFPYLIGTVSDDHVRMDLIRILDEEYGNGDPNRIHARLLFNFLQALGVTEEEVEHTPTDPLVQRFGEEVVRVWKNGPEALAFGLHYALEVMAAALHTALANGLESKDHFSPADIEYFLYHREAEQRHADVSRRGLEVYLHQPETSRGMQMGEQLLHSLYEAFHTMIN